EFVGPFGLGGRQLCNRILFVIDELPFVSPAIVGLVKQLLQVQDDVRVGSKQRKIYPREPVFQDAGPNLPMIAPAAARQAYKVIPLAACLQEGPRGGNGVIAVPEQIDL